MKDPLVRRYARDANPSSVRPLMTATTTLLRYRGMSVQSVALSQVGRHEASFAGAITAVLR